MALALALNEEVKMLLQRGHALHLKSVMVVKTSWSTGLKRDGRGSSSTSVPSERERDFRESRMGQKKPLGQMAVET